MAPSDHHYTDDVELAQLDEDLESNIDPDSPLPMQNTMDAGSGIKQPRWLTQRTRDWRWKLPFRIPEWLVLILKPRLTWRYVLCALLLLYVFYCFVRQSPLLASKLPMYTGPYDVGTMDLEIPLEKPIMTSDTKFKGSKELAFELETVLFSLYYPAAKGSKSKKRKHYWVPKPISLTAEGYASVARINNFFTRPVFTGALWAIAGGIQMPAKVDVPIASSSPTSSDEKPSSQNQTFPVMVFSHGMASSRADYTHYIGELASRGYVVAAIEHRDGSCPGSLLIDKTGNERRILHFDKNELQNMTTPKIKREQLNFRQAEITETVSILQLINSGRGKEIKHANTRDEGTDLASWQGRLNMDKLIIGGHSYGATGALQALKGAPSENNPAKGGIILDPGKSSGPMNHDINVPIMVIHSNSWSKTHSIFEGRPHFEYVKNLVEEVKKRVGASWFMTSLGTSHPSVTDAPLLEPLLLSWTTGATIDVKEGVEEYVRRSLDFFKYVEEGERQGLLKEVVTHESYEKWVSEEREKEFPKEYKKYWEVHVTPDEKR